MKISFLGDIYVSGRSGISEDIKTEGIIVNLEAPFYDSDEPAAGKINLRMKGRDFFETFENRKITAVCLANNHIFDFGNGAFEKTLKDLKDKGIGYFGAGNYENNFNNPYIINGDTALFGYVCRSVHGVYGDESSPGAAPFDLERVLKDLSEYKDKYKIVLNIHWGRDYHSFPDPSDVVTAKKLIDAGAELIIGHHPHIVQSHQVYKDRHIFYSIGNCIFDDLKDVKSFFNGSDFTKIYNSRWKKRNRISLCVNYDTDSGKTDYEYLIYKNRRLEIHPYSLLRLKNKVVPGKFSFLLYKMYLKRKFQIEHFADDPKIPSKNKILKFLGVKK